VLDLEDGSPIDTDLESGGIILNQFLKNSGSVGVDEPSMADFNLYPNPAFDIVELVFEQEEDRLITIVDLSGKQVFQVNTSSMRQRLNLSEIPDGIYLVVIRTDEFKMVKKLVLNH